MLVAPRVRRLTAPNASPMTGPGTNTYLVGEREIAVVDPGPADPAHLDAIQAAAAGLGGRIALILLTHSHPDHLPGAWPLRERTGAPVLGWHTIGGIDQALGDEARLTVDGLQVAAVHTPGHAADHLAYWLPDDRTLIAGDLVSGFGTVVISPPGGDLLDYLTSLERVRALAPRVMLPGHWDPITDPAAKLAEYIAHRGDRERQIVAALAAGQETTLGIVQHVYADTIVPELVAVAQRSVLAHLLKLEREGRVAGFERPDGERGYRLTG